MLNTNTEYYISNSNGTDDLIKIFGINPNNTIIDRPFTINSGTVQISYESGSYILLVQTDAQVTFTNSITNNIYFVCVGGGGGGGGGLDQHPGTGGNGGGFVNGYFAQADSGEVLNVTIGSGGNGGSTGNPGVSGSSGNESSIISSNNNISIVAAGGNGGRVSVGASYYPISQSSNKYSGFVNILTTSPEGIVSGGHPCTNASNAYLSSCGVNGFSATIPLNSINRRYFGGGGGGGGYYQGESFDFGNNISGGLGGGGNGQYNSGYSSDNYAPVVTPNVDGVNYTGGGGGGGAIYNSASTTGKGGNGGKGVVIFYFVFP